MDIKSELYFLVAKFLGHGPCSRSAQMLVQELEENEIIPKSVNWLGEAVTQDFNTFSAKLDHIGGDHLVFILEQLLKAVKAADINDSAGKNRSLLSRRICSPTKEPPSSIYDLLSGRKRIEFHLGRSRENRPFNLIHDIVGRSINGNPLPAINLHSDFFKRIKKSYRVLGHLSSVYCVLFDNTGRYIITGADDTLVKIWSAIDGRLLATLRGASAEIADLTINNENTLLAVGSCDKMIRIWALSTCAPIAILQGQGGNVTSIFFCPMPKTATPHGLRYLASTSSDGSCAFWAYTEEGGKVEFQPKPTLYLERMRPGHAQMICSSFSTGGLFMAAGSADNNVRVYHMVGNEGPVRVLEVECHTDRVDSISWAHKGLRFISGSKDGTALIWRYEYQQWRYLRIHCTKQLPGEVPVAENAKLRPRVTMVSWNTDDTLVICAVSNHLVKVWNPRNGALIRVLASHQDEAFIIEPHPKFPSIICTAGHDGKLIIWDIGSLTKSPNPSENPADPYSKGTILMEYFNELSQGQGHGSIFDAKWSPDGLSLVSTDSHGHVILFGSAEDKKYEKLPPELFFHTDYRPLTRDAITHTVVDEQTQVEPHLMPPPFLVDMEGNPYPPDFQRLVPGRGNCRDEQLIPNVAIEQGRMEIIEGVPGVPQVPGGSPGQPIPPPAASPAVSVASSAPPPLVQVVSAGPANPRSNIDEMIERLANENNVPGERGGAGPSNSGGRGAERTERRGLGLRRSGDIEGVRQSQGNWQTGTFSGYRKMFVVQSMSEGSLAGVEEFRQGHFELETSHYDYHSTTVNPTFTASNPQSSPIASEREGVRSRRLRRLAAQQTAQATRNENANLSRVEGVALPNPPQQERSYVQDSPSRRPTQPSRRNAPAPRRIRYDVRRLLRRHAPDLQDHENDVEAIPSESDTDSDVSNPSSSSSSSSESSESDWGQDRSRGSESRARTERSRKSARRGDRQDSSSNKENGRVVDSDESNNNEPRPGTSTGAKKPPPVPKSRTRKAQKQVQYDLEEIPEHFRPSLWLGEVAPKKSPYFPQLGDELVYFRQGHERYVEFVKSFNLYPMNKKDTKSLPYVSNPNLEAEIAVTVVSIKFEMLPPRLVCLKLNVNDWDTGEPLGTHITVKYHDVTGVVDFLILRQMFDKSLRHNWHEGDRFRCLIDNEWWLGKIISQEPADKKHPHSRFLCYNTIWDNEDCEKMSPWDLEIIPDDFEIPEGKTDGIPASEDDLRACLYEAKPLDWPPDGHQEAECSRISSLLGTVMGLAISEAFLTPVDLNLFPEYAYEIVYPMDLSTIKNRLDNLFYRRQPAVLNDIKYIAINAERFNEPKSDIVTHAKVIRDLCTQIVENPSLQNVNGAYKNIMKFYKETEVAPGTSESARKSVKGKKSEPTQGSSNGTGRTALARKKSNPKLTSESQGSSRGHKGSGGSVTDWKVECHELLDDLWHSQDGIPFRNPVDINEFPDYFRQIETPMNLLSIREDLAGGNYENPQEFVKDLQLIFTNSRTYNTNKKSKIHGMTLRLQSRAEVAIRKLLDNWRRSRRSGSTKSPSKSSRNQKKGGGGRKSRPNRSQKHQNGYGTDGSFVDDEEEVESSPPRSPRRALPDSTRKNSLRNSPRKPSPTLSSLNGHYNTRRGGGSILDPVPGPSTSSGRVIRPVKRLRISSGESNENGEGSETPAKRLKVLLPVPKDPKSKSKVLNHNLRSLQETSGGGRPRRSTAGRNTAESDEEEVGGRSRRGGGRRKTRSEDGSDQEGRGRVETSRSRPKRNVKPNRFYVESDDDEAQTTARRQPKREVAKKRVSLEEENEEEEEEDEFESDGEEEEPEYAEESEGEGDEAMPQLRRSSSAVEEDFEGHEEEEDDSRDGLRRSKRQRKPRKRSSSEEGDGDDDFEVNLGRVKGRKRETRNKGRPLKNYVEDDSDEED